MNRMLLMVQPGTEHSKRVFTSVCKLARVRRRLLSWLQRSFSACIGKAIFRLKHSGSLMLNIHCVVWEKLSLTNAISFASSNSRILKTEIVETTEMLKLIDQETCFRFIHGIYWGRSSPYRMMLKSMLYIRRRQNIMTFGTVCSNLWLKRTKNPVTNVLSTLRFGKVIRFNCDPNSFSDVSHWGNQAAAVVAFRLIRSKVNTLNIICFLVCKQMLNY